MTESVSAMPAVQPVLLPEDADEAKILAQCRLYAALPNDDCRALVRGYLHAQVHECTGRAISRGTWVEASGLGRTKGYEVLSQHAVPIREAGLEAMQVYGQAAAARAITLLSVAIDKTLDAIRTGSLSIRDLSMVHLALIRDGIAISGVALSPAAEGRPRSALARFRAADGAQLELEVTGGDGDSRDPLDQALERLGERQRRTVKAVGEARAADSVRGAAEGGSGAAGSEPKAG